MIALALLAATLHRAPCNDRPRDARVSIPTSGSAFQALPSPDGCWIFVSIPRGSQNGGGAIAVYQRANGSAKLMHEVPVDGGPTGMTVTHDGKMLIVADGDRVAFLDYDKLIADPSKAVLGYQVDPQVRGRIYANTTRDDKYLFVADENSLSVTVIDLPKARASNFALSSIIGRIPTGTLPIALTFSPDEKLIYVTSQWAPTSYNWPIECKRETNNANNDPTPVNAQGAIHVVDVERAKTDPAHSIVANVPAGCSSVRLVLSPDAKRAYVSARNSNALLAFDVAKLRDDPTHARIASIPVGTAPVGVAVTPDSNRVIVTNSNRFAGSANDTQPLTVIDATKLSSGTDAIVGEIPAGAFPREMRVTPDGHTLVLTNFGSKTIQLIDLDRLPIVPKK